MIDIFVIDPPYPKRKGGLRKVRPHQGRELAYKTLTIHEIAEILDDDIFPLAAEYHSIFLWTIDEYLVDMDDWMREREYKRHARFIWDKQNGVAPAFTIRYTHEYLIWFYKGKLQPIEKNMRGKVTTVFREKAREHSRKPDIAYQMIDGFYPNLVKMDVFSREKREGWLQYGDEVDYFKHHGCK